MAEHLLPFGWDTVVVDRTMAIPAPRSLALHVEVPPHGVHFYRFLRVRTP